MIVDAIPKKGRGKYDFLRQLANDLITSRHGPETSDPVWNLLHRVKESQALGGQPSLQSLCPGPSHMCCDAQRIAIKVLQASESAM